MSLHEVEDGAHFWAKVDGHLAVLCRNGYDFCICGPWECSIPERDIEFVAAIPMPAGFTAEHLYYRPEVKEA